MKYKTLNKLRYVNILILIIIIIVLTTFLINGISAGGSNFNIMNFSFNYTGELLKEETYSLKNISELSFSFTSDSIKIFTADDEMLRVVQYGNKNAREENMFIAEKDETAINFSIKDTVVNIFNFSIYNFPRIEIYLPKEYSNNLILKTSSGSIKTESDLNINNLNISTTSGGIRLNDVKGDVFTCRSTSGVIRAGKINVNEIDLQTTSGGIKADSAYCSAIRAESSSGSIKIEDFTGAGRFSANSGRISISNTVFTGDTNVNSTSGSVKLTLSDNNNLEFEGQTNSGSIRSFFELNYMNRNKYAAGVFGNSPYTKLFVKTTSGSIKITQ